MRAVKAIGTCDRRTFLFSGSGGNIVGRVVSIRELADFWR